MTEFSNRFGDLVSSHTDTDNSCDKNGRFQSLANYKLIRYQKNGNETCKDALKKKWISWEAHNDLNQIQSKTTSFHTCLQTTKKFCTVLRFFFF